MSIPSDFGLAGSAPQTLRTFEVTFLNGDQITVQAAYGPSLQCPDWWDVVQDGQKMRINEGAIRSYRVLPGKGPQDGGLR